MTRHLRIPKSKLLFELARRARRKAFSPESACRDIPKELAFIKDSSPYIAAMCSRRAGKTYGCAVKLLFGAYATRLPHLYITLTRGHAKKYIWPDLLRLNEEFCLGGKVNHTDLCITWGLSAGVWLTGVSTEREADRIRGGKFKGIVIDESQAFPAWLSDLISEEIMLTLADYDGWLVLSGTPPNVWLGAFCEAWDSDQFSKHHWTAFDNPYVKIEKLLKRELLRRGVTEDDPSIQREYFGRYVYDPSAVVIPYGERAHLVGELPSYDFYLIAYDTGLIDRDAIVVLGWQRHSQVVDCVYEFQRAKQDISTLGQQLSELRKKYSPIGIVGDTAGLGAKAALEMQRRFTLPIQPAEKSQKMMHVKLLRDAVNTGRFRCRPDGELAADLKKVQWDMAARAKGQEKIDERAYHSDLMPAALYGYRACLAYLEQPKPPEKSEEDKLWAREIKRAKRQKDVPWWQRGRLN